MAVLVDSNVLIDVLTADPTWHRWSSDALRDAADTQPLIINAIVFGEVSYRYTTREAVEEALSTHRLRREAIPFDAAFLAAKVHSLHRARGGQRTATLPHLYIGAHAAVAGHRLLTRDATRYRSYFPRLDLIAPN
jgi:predicted nucleic acid-binding protein